MTSEFDSVVFSVNSGSLVTGGVQLAEPSQE